MAADTTQEELRRHLRELDAEIAQVRRVTDDAKGNVGGEGGGVEDSAEIAEDLTNIEEQDAVLGILRNHRADILAELKRWLESVPDRRPGIARWPSR